MFGRDRRAKRRRSHDEESRARALEVVAGLAEVSTLEREPEPDQINRAQLSRAAMARQATNPGQEIHRR
jgi:hypothetical protein